MEILQQSMMGKTGASVRSAWRMESHMDKIDETSEDTYMFSRLGVSKISSLSSR